MCGRPGVRAVGFLFAHEHLKRANLEYGFGCFYRIDCGHCCPGVDLDYEPPQPQYADGTLVVSFRLAEVLQYKKWLNN